MKFQKGNTYGKGRPKGSKNKDQKSILEIYSEVFDLMWGVPKFLEWASKNPAIFYGMHSKLAPVQIKLASEEAVVINLSLDEGAKKLCNELGLEN
jgi:dihydroorotase